jgi:hypothetical protein
MSLRISMLALAALVLVAPGCSAKPGGSCDEKGPPNTCLDPKTRLHCEGGTWKAEACLGPKGCSGDERNARCDTSVANEGDACQSDRGYSCTPDKKTELRCKGGSWTAIAQCTGKNGCDASGFFVRCDGALVAEGGECEAGKDPKQKSYGCSLDKKAALLCKDDKWTRIEQCLGAEGCEAGFLGISCKGPTAKPGDFCDPGDKPDFACSPEGKARVVCDRENAWKVDRSCLGEKGCTSSILGVECDSSVAPPGEACSKEGSAVCSTDGKTILECKGGKYLASKKCEKACKVNSLFVQCDGD